MMLNEVHMNIEHGGKHRMNAKTKKEAYKYR